MKKQSKRSFLVFSIILILALNMFCFLHFMPLAHATTTLFDISSYSSYVFNEVADTQSYQVTHDAAIGTSAGSPCGVGQAFYYNGEELDDVYRIERGYLRFDTTALAGATVSAARLMLYGVGDYSDTDFYIRTQCWTESADGVSVNDYDAFDGVYYDDSSLSTSFGWAGRYNNSTITNFDIICLGGYTNITLRSSRDISSTDPAGLEYVGIANSPNGAKLEVTYTEGTAPEYDYVDSQTDVDSSADKGTHSSFTAQQATDWTNDSLIEANTNTTVVNNAENFVDSNTSDQDGHTGHGTSSNFTAQQDANIAYNDTLTEANTAGTTSDIFTSGFEVGKWDSQWDGNGATTWLQGTNSTPGTPWVTHSGTNMSYALSANDGNLISDDIDLSGASAAGISFWYMVDDEEETDFRFYYYNGSTYNLQTLDLGLAATEDVWYKYSEVITDVQYLKSNFRIDFNSLADANEGSFVDDILINKTLNNNYELDYEFSWTTASFSEANEYLCIRTNSYSGTAENLGVDVWDGSWKSISNALTASAWNNISITTNLTGATIYFRFIGKTESSDTAQNTWNIECNLIHTWSVGVNYELDLEEQFTSANFSRTSVELCVRMGAYNTTENIRLDYWNASASAWIVAIATLTTNVWNNVSVKAYTSNASVTFTVRLVGVTESGDLERSAWNKDACLLHTWDAGTANLAPTIPDLRLSATTDTSNITQIDVNSWYDWEVNVSDSGTLLDIVNVTIRLKDNPTDSIITDSAAYNRTGEYWFNYDNASNIWQWYSGASWTATSDWLDNANCAAPTKTDSSGYYLFRTKLAKSAVHTATWGFSALAYDSGDNVTSKNFTAITINAYSSLTIMSGNNTHTWANATAGVNDILIDQDAIYFNVTANYLFKIQAEGDGNLIKGSDYIVLANVTIHKDTLGSSVPLTTSYADVVGLTSQALGEDVQLSLKLWLDSPANQPVGDYLYQLSIQVTEVT